MNNPELSPILDLPKILGIPKRGIIFSDLDGVWFDEANNFSQPAPALLRSITLAQKSGFWVVMNSDTAPTTLERYANSLGANGWVIGENGGVIYLPDEGNWYLSPAAPLIETLRNDLLNRLSDQPDRPYIWQGDATPFIQRQGELIGGLPGQVAYLVNTARTCSIGIYTRVIGPDGSLGIDDAQTKQTEDVLNTILAKQDLQANLVCKRYPNLGSCLVKDPTISKATAVERIVNQYGKGLSYWMIGDRVYDSMSDLAGDVRVGAVGNADQGLKTEALGNRGVVAPPDQTIARGADFIIREILRREDV